MAGESIPRAAGPGSHRRVISFLPDSLRPSRNPILAVETSGVWRSLVRSPLFAFVVLLAIAQVVLSVVEQVRDSVDLQEGAAFYFLYFHAQFTAFHLLIYVSPLVFFYSSWKRRIEDGKWEAFLLTRSSRGDWFWAFFLPRYAAILAVLFAFYVPMWPWDNWWLVWFEAEKSGGWFQSGIRGDFPSPDVCWSHLHVLVTTLYFVTELAFGGAAAVWVALRVRRWFWGILVLLGMTVLLDLGSYVVAMVVMEAPFDDPVISLLSWPGVLWTLLAIHCLPGFAAIFYPAKWILTAFFVRDIIRGVPHWRWTREFRGGAG